MLLERELTIVLGAHLLAAIPIGFVLVASRISRLYAFPSEQLARWWAWFALIVATAAVFVGAVL